MISRTEKARVGVPRSMVANTTILQDVPAAKTKQKTVWFSEAECGHTPAGTDCDKIV